MDTNLLTKQVGPLKTWVWMLIGLGLALAYALYRQRKASASQPDTSGNATGTGADSTDYATGNNTVPDFISQNYVTTTVNNPAPTQSLPPTAPPPSTTPTTPTTPSKPTTPSQPSKPKYTTYVVKKGDTLDAIAKKYKTSWQDLWKFNTTAGVRPAETIATLKKRGPNLLYSGEKILIPTK